MNTSRILAATALAIVCFALNPVSADAPSAEKVALRCDPGVVIKSIDGGDEVHTAGNGPLFVECSISLAPGFHELETCYQVRTGDLVAECKENALLQIVDAKPGSAYRVRLQLDMKSKSREGWKTWVEDVTASESQFSFEKPAKKPKPSGSKKDLETIAVLGASPEHAWLFMEKGQLLGKWFMSTSGMFGPLRSKGQSTAGVPGGYHIVKVTAGDTIALTGGRMMEGSAFVAKGMHLCEDFPLRVYENLPGGKVLYLGHLNILRTATGYAGTYSDDLEAARKYLEQSEPELAKRLEPAAFRVLSVADACLGRGYDLVAAPQR